MKKKDFIFTLGLTMLMGILWVVGEVVMGLWLAVPTAVHIGWFVAIVVVTLAINIWHMFKTDKADSENPKISKYERKVGKRIENKKNKRAGGVNNTSTAEKE